MKKFALIAALVSAMTMSVVAQATEVGLSLGRNSVEQDVSRVNVGTEVKGVLVDGSLSRVRSGSSTSDVVALTAGKQLFTVGKGYVDVFAGPAFAQTSRQVSVATGRRIGGPVYGTQEASQSGFGLVYGVKFGYPVAQNVDVVVDARRFEGQERVASANGNTVSAGVVLKF